MAQRPWSTIENPHEPIRTLSDDQVAHLQRSALQLLATTGMRVLDQEARRRYAAAGCAVDGEMVRFDPDMVLATVATAPSTFRLRARNRTKDLHFGGRSVVFASVGGPAFVSDIHGGRRPGTDAEQVDYLKVVQQLDVVHQEGGGPFEAMDLPATTRHLHLYRNLALLLDKNFQGTALGRERARDCLEITALALGTDLDGLASDPALLTIVNTNTPLTLDIPMAEGLIELASAGQAVCVTPFTLAGAMAPATLAGALVLQHAEVMAAATLVQLVRPGCPTMYGSFTSNVDMRSGSPAFGTPEYTKAAQAGGQLARHLGLPYRSSNTTGSNAVDAQAVYESSMSLLGAVMGGAHLVNHAAGWLEGGLTGSFEKLIVDAEMLQLVASWLEPIEVNDAEMGLDAIAEVGPGGHFFASAHTMARYEHAFYEPMLSDRHNFETWVEQGSVDTTRRAAGVWQRLVESYERPPIDSAIVEAIDDYVSRRERELSH